MRFAWLFSRIHGSVIPALVLHTAVNARTLTIPAMVRAGGSRLRPFQIAVGMLALAAASLLCWSQPLSPAAHRDQQHGPPLVAENVQTLPVNGCSRQPKKFFYTEPFQLHSKSI